MAFDNIGADLGLGAGGALSGVGGIFSSILNIITTSLGVLLILAPICYMLYKLYRVLLFKHRIVIFGLVGKSGLRNSLDWGRVINKKDGTTEYKLKSGKRKRWLVPVPKREHFVPADLTGASTLYLAKTGEGDSDCKWLNPYDIFEETKILTIDSADRKEFVNMHQDTERKYTKQNAWEKYKDIIIPLAFGILFVGAMVFAMIYISEMWQTTVQQAGILGSDMKEAAEIYAEGIKRAAGII